MTKVAILGGSGYTALELIKLLLNHPQVEIAALTTRQQGSPSVDSVHPSLAGRLHLPLENLTPAEVAKRASFVFTALPHVAAMGVVPDLLAHHFSRLKDRTGELRPEQVSLCKRNNVNVALQVARRCRALPMATSPRRHR